MKTSRPFDETCEAAALYALGKLPETEAGRFEQRLNSGCPLCRTELEHCQHAAENLLLAANPVQPDPGLEARLFDRIGKVSPRHATPAAQPKIVRAGNDGWKQVAPGVRFRFLHQDRTMLVRMDPGARYPEHQHAFDEQCLVLEGAIEDTEGNKASAGDFVLMPKGSTHPPIFTEMGALLLVAYT